MDAVGLVAAARAAGLRFSQGPNGDLLVRGPRTAHQIVNELRWRKHEVLAVLRAEADAQRHETQAPDCGEPDPESGPGLLLEDRRR